MYTLGRHGLRYCRVVEERGRARKRILTGQTENSVACSSYYQPCGRRCRGWSLSPVGVVPGPASLPRSPLPVPTSRPNAIKLLAAGRANGEMSLTVVVIAGACRVSRFKSSLLPSVQSASPGDRPRLPGQTRFLFLSAGNSLVAARGRPSTRQPLGAPIILPFHFASPARRIVPASIHAADGRRNAAPPGRNRSTGSSQQPPLILRARKRRSVRS